MQKGHQQKHESSQGAAAGRSGVLRSSSQQHLLPSRHTPVLNIQPKLNIGQAGDKHEQEADRVADQVVSTSSVHRTPSFEQRTPNITPVISQKVDATPEEESQLQEEEQQPIQDLAPRLQRETLSAGTPGTVLQKRRRPSLPRAPPLQLQGRITQVSNIQQFQNNPSQNSTFVRSASLQCRAPPVRVRSEASEGRLEHELAQSRGGGLPLPEKTKNRMEAGIGADFSSVRIHTDGRAAQMNTMLGSQAFATGNDIFFGSGKYDPENTNGQRLLAHELTHTVQQNAVPKRKIPPAIAPRAPPIQQTATSTTLQGGFIGDRLNEYARHVPGWPLLTVIVGYNPLTEQEISRTPQNFLGGFMGLVPGGTALFDKLSENGLITEAFAWLTSQLDQLNLSWSRLRSAIDAAWDNMDFIRLDPFDYNLRILKRHILPIWNDVKSFGSRIVEKAVGLVRSTMLTPLVNFIKDRTRAYPLLRVILGSDPITGEQVDRSLYNIVSAFLILTESGEEYLNKLNESGKLQDLSEWLDAEIVRLDISVETVTNVFIEAWDLLDLNAVLHPIETFTRLFSIFSAPVIRLVMFVVTVALKVLGLIKDWLLGLLREHADKIPGYSLLKVILGQDPLTGAVVPRTAENFIRGFLRFVPGGMEKFNNLKESGAIDKAFAWLEEAIVSLGLIGESFVNAFTQIWQSLSINDLADPIAVFQRVVDIFTEPLQMLIDFAIEVGMKVLEFIFEGVLGPTGARVLAIMKKARSTFITIIKNPMAFVGHLIDALATGFRNFSSNILNHLRNGLVAWLTGTLSGAGIQLPERFDFKGIVSVVLQILGITWPRIREKLVRRMGERTVAFLETSFDIIRLLITEGPGALWERLMEHVSNLKDTVMEGIRNFIMTRIVTAAVTKLATMWNPAGAVIQAILGIYNTIMFFIERINQILDLVESVVNSVSRIASGAISEAADFVEQAMGRTIPVILGFMARLIGLGNISSAIQNIILRVQSAVDRGIERVLDWIGRQGRRLFSRLTGRGDPAAQQAVDPATMTPDEKKGAARQELEQWIRGGDRQGGAIKAKLPQLKQKYQLSDLRVEMTDQGPRIAYYASPPVFTYFFEEEKLQNVRSTTSAGFKMVHSAAGVPTPKGVISKKYPKQLAKDAFRCSANTLDRPGSVSAEQTGIGSSENRGSSSVQGNAGYVGLDEEQIMAGHRNTSYRGGHLIAYVILGANSNQGYNLAPQVNRFNAPSYFKIFEEVAMKTPTTVEISVDVGYASQSYQVDQQTLVDRGILTHIDMNRDWTVRLAKRIPNTWNATIVAKEGTLVTGGVSSNTDTARQGRVVTSEAAFNALRVDGDGDTEKVQKWNSFKMLITEGGQRNQDNSITTGGETRLSIRAEQLDFSAPPVQSPPETAVALENNDGSAFR